MSQLFVIHPQNPQMRLIRQAAGILAKGSVIAYPTDSCYALGCHIGDTAAMEKLRSIRRLDAKHHFTLMCNDLSSIGTYAKVDNSAYRLLKAQTPGAYTFILKASREVPRRLQHVKRKTIGIRVPDNVIAQALVAEIGEPILTTSLILPSDDLPLSDPYEIRDMLSHHIELVIDGGYCGLDETTVVDLVESAPKIIREGKGDITPFT